MRVRERRTAGLDRWLPLSVAKAGGIIAEHAPCAAAPRRLPGGFAEGPSPLHNTRGRRGPSCRCDRAGTAVPAGRRERPGPSPAAPNYMGKNPKLCKNS